MPSCSWLLGAYWDAICREQLHGIPSWEVQAFIRRAMRSASGRHLQSAAAYQLCMSRAGLHAGGPSTHVRVLFTQRCCIPCMEVMWLFLTKGLLLLVVQSAVTFTTAVVCCVAHGSVWPGYV